MIKRIYVLLAPQTVKDSMDDLEHHGQIVVNPGVGGYIHYYSTLGEAENAQENLCKGQFKDKSLYKIAVVAWEDGDRGNEDGN